MNIKLHIPLCLLFLLFGLASTATVKRVLFIGNSYTAVNNLPNTLLNLALSMGDTILVDNNTPGGFTFNQHSTNATTLAKIQSGNWDFVIHTQKNCAILLEPIIRVQRSCFI